MAADKRAIWVKKDGEWVAVDAPSVNSGGTDWLPLKAGFVNVAGVWQQYYPSTGDVTFNTAGTYTWKVPPGIHKITVDMVGAGGGGGSAHEVGAGAGGGGGGSGGFLTAQEMSVKPGEIITIKIGSGGVGGPYTGRGGVTNGSAGTETSVQGALASIGPVTGGQGGTGGTSYDSGGGKIICTKLYELGLMDYEIYEADQAFGKELVKIRPDIYNGYRAWAEIVVEWMDGRGPKMMPWMSDEEFSKAAKKWSTKWAQDIATPWAEEMAYRIGKRLLDNSTGKVIMAVGTPICKVVGVWQRWFGPSKKPAGFGRGLMLIPVFVLLKVIAELGKLLEKR